MTCESCGDKPKKCDKGFTKAVVEINNPGDITLMRKVVVPASMGDDTAVPPVVGKYRNVLLYYEANSKSYLYSSDGIPTQLVNGFTNYEEAINLPEINGVTLMGNKSSADLELADAPMVITVASGNTSWSGADTAEDVYNFFLNKGKVNIVFNGGENYAYEVTSAAYIPEEEKMMCIVTVATATTGETTEFDGNTLFGTMILYTADKAIDVSQIELQPKLFVADFTGLNLNYNELSGVPATTYSIGMVKPGDGLEVASDGTMSISDIEQYAHIFETTANMLQYNEFAENEFVKTLGYNTINDGGGAIFKIVSGSLTPDNKSIYQVNNNLFAVIQPLGYKINVKQFGITGKSNYDTDFAWLATYINTNNIEEVAFNDETYNVTNYIEFNVAATTFTMNFNGGTIKLNSSFRYYEYGIFTINMDKDKNTKCYILNGNFDGSGNPADFSEDNVHPKGGRGMFFINGARYIKADHLNFNDWFYSACIWSHYCKTGDFTNIVGIRVGGRSADNTEDARGDALYFGYLGVVNDGGGNIDPDNSYPVEINIKNCQFSSWPAIPTMYPDASTNEGRNGSQSGRAGIVLGEYSRTNAYKVFNISDCYFYNYQRTLHLENVYNIDVNVTRTYFSEYGQVLIGTANDRYNNVKFNNCIFNKTIDVIAIYNDYKFIVSGFTTNNWKHLEFENCSINDEYNGLILLGSGIDISFNNCIINMEKFFVYNSYSKFYNSNIKYNQVNFYLSEYLFANCTMEGCYKHDANSKSILYAVTTTNDGYNKVLECRLKNVSFHQGGTGGRKVEIVNNFLEYDSNYVNVDYAGTTRNYFLSVYGDKLEKFDGNIVDNRNTTVTVLMDTANNGSFVIADNTLINTRAGLINGTGYKAIFRNNKFVADNASFTNPVSDLYGSKCVFHDNQYIGYTSVMSNYSGATQYNNYYTTDGTSNTLVV